MTALEATPRDRYNLIYMIVFFLGISGHLPWNAILTAQPYFNVRLSRSSIGSEFTAHFAIIFKALKLAVFAAVSLTGIRINNRLWVGVSALGNVVVFSILAAMVNGGRGGSVNIFYLVTLSLVIAAGLFLALFECGMYSILGPFPSRLTQSFLAGNAIGGILTALNLIVSFYSASADIYASTRIYFIVSVVVFLVSLGSFIVFLGTEYCQFYQKRLALYTVVSQVSSPRDLKGPSKAALLKDDSEELLGTGDKRSRDAPTAETEGQRLLQKLWQPVCALFFIGVVNLTIFPALVSVTESTAATSRDASFWKKELFVPLAFLVVSTADFLGKLLPSWRRARFEMLPFTTLSLGRFALVPLFLLGNIRYHGASLIYPAVLASDHIYHLLLVVTFVSGSYLATMIMTTAPKHVDVTEQSRATVLLCSGLQLGVFAGAIFALVLKLLLRLFVRGP